MLEPERILRLEDDRVVFLDQRRLPLEEVEVECRTAAEVADAIRTMVVRGAPAIGVAAAYGYALAVAHGEDRPRRPTASCASRARPRSTSPGRSTRCTTIPRPSTRARLHADEVERCRRMAAHTAELLDAGDARPHPLQRRRARDGRLRQRGRRAADGVGARPARARLGRRDAAAPAGRAADRLGARDRRDPARGDRRLRRRVADGARRGRLRDHRRRPDRRQRRHRQQDRHLLARRSCAAPRDPALRRRADARPSTSRPPTAVRSRSRNETRPR